MIPKAHLAIETRADWEIGSDLTILAMKDSLSEWDDCEAKYQARPASADVVGKLILCSPSGVCCSDGRGEFVGKGDNSVPGYDSTSLPPDQTSRYMGKM